MRLEGWPKGTDQETPFEALCFTEQVDPGPQLISAVRVQAYVFVFALLYAWRGMNRC